MYVHVCTFMLVCMCMQFSRAELISYVHIRRYVHTYVPLV